LRADIALAESLFDRLSLATRSGRGIVRDSYGAGEQAAHDIMRAAADAIGLEVSVDAIGNLLMVLPGRDRTAPQIIVGSHLDSVPQGRGVSRVWCQIATSRSWAFARRSRPGSTSPTRAAAAHSDCWILRV
jgi:N-carbamoyl-L-amino-acid hydrolase